MIRILFVCLGNICRSCAAQAIMQRLVDRVRLSKEFEIDSAGLIDYHEGEPADKRMRSHAARRGVRIIHLSRPITIADFHHFDIIIGMDSNNVSALRHLATSSSTLVKKSPDEGEKEMASCMEAKIHLMTEYSTNAAITNIPDPYYGDASDFEYVLDLLEDSCQGLLASLMSH